MPDYIHPPAKPLDCSSYSRYVDDTSVIASGHNIQHLIDIIIGISSSIFPPSIPISLELSVFFSSFLDVCFFPHFGASRLSTFLRLNFDAPSKIRHYTSNHPKHLLNLPGISNTIRALRTCSEDIVFNITKELFISEYVKAGFPESSINDLRTRLGRYISKHSQFPPLAYQSGVPDEVQDPDPVFKYFPGAPSITFCKCCDFSHVIHRMIKCVSVFLPVQHQSLPASLMLDAKARVSSKRIYRDIIVKYKLKN